ncbi:transketolase subunit A [Alkalibaculum bacchi]|uniref:Transketolase subunit A n=1 Tax=Alkalibaculum bacchi TaxID=645887 RepID=A0A366I650_9FIRM|nr:transketolase [Alkalibaculum bacchi]RBP62583.1 transketolase subunit A [Alkalibaculum bacchi]
MADLKAIATNIRQSIIKEIANAASGHPGGSLSGVEILTLLYFEVMNIDPKDPKKAGRDKFVLSKGHASPLLYATLAERGFFEKEELLTFRKIDSRLQGHPDMKNVPGVDMSTGSLGQGLSAAVGMAIANKLDGNDAKVYALLGDGELAEGMIWEAAMSASHYNLDNLIAFVDYNGLQIDGRCCDVMNSDPIDGKFAAFNWNVINVEDGHDFDQIREALGKVVEGKPNVLVCKTIKGKGVSFMEDQAGWHGSAPNEEQTKQALAELGGTL